MLEKLNFVCILVKRKFLRDIGPSISVHSTSDPEFNEVLLGKLISISHLSNLSVVQPITANY